MRAALILALALMLMSGARAEAEELVLAPSGPLVPVSSRLFGVNYVWHLVPADVFPAMRHTLRDIGATVVRYPGGRIAERFDWRGNKAPTDFGPGVDPDSFLADLGTTEASFVTPSLPATRDPSRIGPLTARTVRLVQRFGGRVRLWEIGNEWWLQRGAKNDPETRAENFTRYAALLAAVAPAIKAADPNAVVFATGDWTRPAEFRALRDAVGPVGWAAVDGISVHPYCGDLDPETLCSLIPARMDAIRLEAGKKRIYASEWSLGTKVTANDWGVRNANLTVGAFRQLASSGVSEAAYWPPMRGAPEIALMTSDGRATATGILFGWVSRALREMMLPVSDPSSLAGRARDGEVTLVVPALGTARNVEVDLARFGARRAVSAELLHSDDPVGGREASVDALPVRVMGHVARFTLPAWQIGRVVMR